MTDININKVVKNTTTLNCLITFKNIKRILKNIRRKSNGTLTSKQHDALRDVGLLDLFNCSDKIADKKYPTPLNKEYLDYRIEHFINVLKQKQLVIG